MAEKPVDDTVSLQYEYMDDSKIQDYQLTLTTTVSYSTCVIHVLLELFLSYLTSHDFGQ